MLIMLRMVSLIVLQENCLLDDWSTFNIALTTTKKEVSLQLHTPTCAAEMIPQIRILISGSA